MTSPNAISTVQMLNAQSSQVEIEDASRPQSLPSQQDFLLLGGGLILTFALLLYWWHKKQIADSRRSTRSNRNSDPIDWYQAEFNCGPLAGNPFDHESLADDAANPSKSPTEPLSLHPPNAEPLHPEPSDYTGTLPTPILLSDRYSAFIDQMIEETLQGKICSKDYVYDRFVEQLEPKTGEIFERCLVKRINTLQYKLRHETDELKQAKFGRQARALDTIQEAWERWQQVQQIQVACQQAAIQLVEADRDDRLSVLLQIIDPNQTYIFNHQQIALLAKELDPIRETVTCPLTIAELHSIVTGLKQGLAAYTAIESHLVDWIYENPQYKYVGFEASAKVNTPWNHWAKQDIHPLPQILFAGQALNHSAMAIPQQQTSLDLSAWIELIILLRGIQNGLVAWFDKQPYSFQFGQNLSAATFLAFAIIWCELSNGFRQAEQWLEADRLRLSRACFQITLQILRSFAQRANFPLYGGIFATFSGESFRDTITYLDQPLRAIEKNQEKARILTVLGYSQQWIGNLEQAKQLHQEALNLAHQATDQLCEIANLNHLSRLSLSQRNFTEAIHYGQRALLFARQIGDLWGEANAIANQEYAKMRRAQQQELVSTLDLEDSIQRLERGLKLAQKHQDWMSEILTHLGLGLTYLLSDQSSMAQSYLLQALETATRMANLELEGMAHAMLAEAHYQMGMFPEALCHACLGLYLLNQKQAIERQQVSNLVMLLKGQLGESFQKILDRQRSQLVSKIGVDGFDDLLDLLQHA